MSANESERLSANLGIHRSPAVEGREDLAGSADRNGKVYREVGRVVKLEQWVWESLKCDAGRSVRARITSRSVSRMSRRSPGATNPVTSASEFCVTATGA